MLICADSLSSKLNLVVSTWILFSSLVGLTKDQVPVDDPGIESCVRNVCVPLVEIMGLLVDIVGWLDIKICWPVETVGWFIDTASWLVDRTGWLVDTTGWFVDIKGCLVATAGWFIKSAGLFFNIIGWFNGSADLLFKHIDWEVSPSLPFILACGTLSMPGEWILDRLAIYTGVSYTLHPFGAL